MLHNLINRLKPSFMQSSTDLFRAGKCPICKEKAGFYDGPSGGLSQNIQCANEKCGAWFNLSVISGRFILEGIRGTVLPEGREARDI